MVFQNIDGKILKMMQLKSQNMVMTVMIQIVITQEEVLFDHMGSGRLTVTRAFLELMYKYL